MGHTLAHSGGCRDSVNGKEDLKTVYMQVEIRDVKNRSLILRSYLYYSHEQEDTTFLYMVESSKSCYNRWDIVSQSRKICNIYTNTGENLAAVGFARGHIRRKVSSKPMFHQDTIIHSTFTQNLNNSLLNKRNTFSSLYPNSCFSTFHTYCLKWGSLSLLKAQTSGHAIYQVRSEGGWRTCCLAKTHWSGALCGAQSQSWQQLPAWTWGRDTLAARQISFKHNEPLEKLNI